MHFPLLQPDVCGRQRSPVGLFGFFPASPPLDHRFCSSLPVYDGSHDGQRLQRWDFVFDSDAKQIICCTVRKSIDVGATLCMKGCQILLNFPSLACHHGHVGSMDPHVSQCDNGGMTTLCAIDKSNTGLRIRVRLAITSGGRMERAKAPSRPCGRCRRHPTSAFNLLSYLSFQSPSCPPRFSPSHSRYYLLSITIAFGLHWS